MKFSRRGSILAVLLLAACARLQGEDRVQSLLDRPLPDSDQGRAMQCDRVAYEISQQRLRGNDPVAMATDPFNAAKKREEAAHAIVALDARQKQLHCDDLPASARMAPPASPVPAPAAGSPTPASPAAAAPMDADAGFDRCFKRCRQYTDRSKEQCFDTCGGKDGR
jgi:hypothetical protein